MSHDFAPTQSQKRPRATNPGAAVQPLGLLLTCLTASVFAGEKNPPPSWFAELQPLHAPDFVHFNGMTGEFTFVEMTGQGGALFDYDRDGDLDLYLVQGSLLGKNKTYADALLPPRRKPPMDRLFRNDLSRDEQGRLQPHFVDITETSGIRATGYGMGVAVADVDQDGWPDLYVTQYGANLLLRNRGDGGFEDITGKSGTAGDNAWSTSASFFDYDKDGLPDLYVVNYVDYDIEQNKRCYANDSRRDYCGPAAFAPQADRFYRNLGAGRFEEVTLALLKDYRPGPGLGVVAADLNGDGWPDLYVANDGTPNQYWINQAGQGFIDDALFAGVAVNGSGRAEASMGVAAGDFDNDGDEDLFLTHLMGETNTLYVNREQGLFQDQTIGRGLAADSFPYTAFGTGWLDLDNDSWLDLLVLNGAVQVIRAQAEAGDMHPLHQPNQAFLSLGGERFRELLYTAESPLRCSQVSRGASFGDIDNDGDSDVVIHNNGGPVQVLLNNKGQNNPWLGLRLLDPRGNETDRARAELKLNDGVSLWRQARRDGSYCSANDPRILFGLGSNAKPQQLTVHWPDGKQTRLQNPPLNRYIELRQPAGKAEPVELTP